MTGTPPSTLSCSDSNSGQLLGEKALNIKTLIIFSRTYSSVYGKEEIAAIRQRVDLIADPLTREELAERPELLADVEVIFSGWHSPVLDEAFLHAAPKLRAYFYAAGSVKGVVTNAVWQRKIRVSSAWGINGASVADYTVGAILFSLKQGFSSAAAQRRQRSFTRLPLPAGVCGSTVAVIALGASGRAVCEKLRPFGVRVIAHDPYVSPATSRALGVTAMVSLPEAFAAADVVSLHLPANDETRGIVRASHLRAMPIGATLINTARGMVIHEAELIEVLKERRDLTAILDVTEPEPPAPESPLFDLPNVVLTPHIAGALDRDARLLSRCMIEEFDRWSSGQPLKWEIAQGDIERMA